MSKCEEQHPPVAKESNAVAPNFLGFCGPLPNTYRKKQKNTHRKGLDLRTAVELQLLILVEKDIQKQPVI